MFDAGSCRLWSLLHAYLTTWAARACSNMLCIAVLCCCPPSAVHAGWFFPDTVYSCMWCLEVGITARVHQAEAKGSPSVLQ